MAGKRYIMQLGLGGMRFSIYDSSTDAIIAHVDESHGELIRDLLNANDKEVADNGAEEEDQG